MALFDPLFWRSIGWALIRTLLAGVVPFIPALTADPASAWLPALATVGLLLVTAVATSLKGLADPVAVPWWQILVSRGLRQFGQFVAAGLVGAVVLSDVNWQALLTAAAASAISTVILAALTLIPGDAPIPGELITTPDGTTVLVATAEVTGQPEVPELEPELEADYEPERAEA